MWQGTWVAEAVPMTANWNSVPQPHNYKKQTSVTIVGAWKRTLGSRGEHGLSDALNVALSEHEQKSQLAHSWTLTYRAARP